MSSHRILVVEDDPNIREMLAILLKDNALDYEMVSDGEQGVERALSQDVTLVLLDVKLPSMDGFEVCRRIRRFKPSLPIIMLTSRGEEIDRVVGLELGADDYVVKPFSPHELIARIRARLRAASRVPQSMEAAIEPPARDQLTIGDLVMDPIKRTLTVGGAPVSLTMKEFDVLYLLARNPGRAFSREELMQQVWGFYSEAYAENVTTLVARLRKKIESDPSQPKYVHAIRGLGYRFAECDELDGE